MGTENLSRADRSDTLPAVTPGARALYSVATSFDAGTDPATISGALVRRAAEAVGSRQAWLLAPEEKGVEAVVAAWPCAGDPPPQGDTAGLRLPLFCAGEPVGTLVLAPPPPGSFSPGERRLANALSHPAGPVAAHARRLAAAEDRARQAAETAALQAEVVAAVDHDLRTPLTTVLGALQTLARPEFAPSDPDLAALLYSALGQAQRLRALLGDLLLASVSEPRAEVLDPSGLRRLITEATRTGMGEGAIVPIDIPPSLSPITVDPPALRRMLAGVFRAICRRGLEARVEVTAWDGDAVIAISAGGEGPLVPDLSARLAGATGAILQESTGADGSAVVQLVLPGALHPADPTGA